MSGKQSPPLSGRLLVLFVATTQAPAIGLAWLGWRLVEQDRALENQRIQERRDHAADAAATALQRILAEVEEKPAAISAAPPGAEPAPALSPDGELLAYYSRRPGSLHVVVRTLKTGEEKDLPLGLGVVPVFGSGPKWFPDGSILVLSRDSQRPGFGFSRVELASGKRDHAKQSGFQGFAFSPDGKTIFYTEGIPDTRNFGTSLMRFDVDTRQVTELKTGEWFMSPAVSPDGKQLAYLVSVRPGSSSYLAVMPTAGGESREVFRDSPFDRYVNGERSALTPEQQLGLRVFRGKGNCTACHVGPNFTDESLHNTGVAWREGELADPGAGEGRFKTPTLREVARTAPYMHDGSLGTLEDVIEFYDRGGNRNPHLDPELRPLRLTAEEKRALIAFLGAVSSRIREGS